MTWQFGANDSTTVKLWSERVARDAEKQQFFAPMMYSLDNPKALRSPDAAKSVGIIRVNTEFAGKAGDRVTITNIARLKDRGIHGDGLLQGTGGTLSPYSMDLYFEPIAEQVRTAGPLSERRTVMNFRKEARKALGSWGMRKTEEGIVLALWGLTTWANTKVLDNWNSGDVGETQTFLNAIQPFDSSHILYAGDATSDATIDSSDVMTAQLITKAETTAIEDLDIPIERLNINGEDSFVMLCSNKALEQLKYDQDFKDAFQQGAPRSNDNPVIKRAVGRYSMTWIVPYPKTLYPLANVSRAILCGADALQMAKVEDWSWFEDFEDTRKRRKVVSVGAELGIAPTYFNGTRRNAIAIDHYVRS